MAAVVTGSKVVTVDVAPHLKAAMLTALLAVPVEDLTVAQVDVLHDVLSRVDHGGDPGTVFGSVLR